MKISRIVSALCLFACLAGGAAQSAAATGPACSATVGRLRFEPVVSYVCDAAIAGDSTFTVTRVSSGASVPIRAPAFSGNTAAVEINATLASSASYRIAASIDDGGTAVPVTKTWTTMAPPAHPKLSIEYILAIPDAAAEHDLLQRVDAANLFAPPTKARVIDAGGAVKSAAQIESALKGRQAALVVGGDESFTFPGNLGAALAWFAGKGHGVVTAGQTHWRNGSAWHLNSAVGFGGAWDNKWDIFGDTNLITSDRIAGGKIATSTIQKHFVTAGLKSFKVVGPSTGEPAPHFGLGSTILAYFPKTGPLGSFTRTYAQAFLTVRQVNASRLVDLGYRPWASTLPGGGFDPAVSPGGTLLARSLWWSMNRIAPNHTHFTTEPPKRSAWATVTIGFAASDADLDHAGALRFHYRLDGGRWKLAVNDSAVFYNLAKGRYHTVSVYSTDSGGNRDPKTTSYRFYVNGDARS